MEEIRQILAGLDWSPLFISIKTGIAATIVSFFLGIWAARKVLKAKTGLRAVLDGILTRRWCFRRRLQDFSAAHFQYEKNRWIVSLYDI